MPQISPPRVRYGVSIVRILEKIDCVLRHHTVSIIIMLTHEKGYCSISHDTTWVTRQTKMQHGSDLSFRRDTHISPVWANREACNFKHSWEKIGKWLLKVIHNILHCSEGPIPHHGLTGIAARISYYSISFLWDGFTHPSPKFNISLNKWI